MGYVPPSIEEWENPELMLKRIRREERRTMVILVAGIVGIVVIAVQVMLR